MPASVIRRPKARAALVGGSVEDGATQRALDDVATAVNKLEQAGDRVSVAVDLIIGDNRINHGLGRKPNGATLTPTVADASFAWAMTSADERQVVIEVIGAAQPGAEVELH